MFFLTLSGLLVGLLLGYWWGYCCGLLGVFTGFLGKLEFMGLLFCRCIIDMCG